MNGLEDRVAKRIRVTDRGCWEYDGARDPHGYGRMRKPEGGTAFVHRYVYAVLVADPGDLSLDHLCRNPPCCNPEHLEPVTHTENVRRGVAAETTRARYAEHLFCPKGHPLFGENLYLHVNKRGWKNKQCRICRRDTRRARRAAGARY